MHGPVPAPRVHLPGARKGAQCLRLQLLFWGCGCSDVPGPAPCAEAARGDCALCQQHIRVLG